MSVGDDSMSICIPKTRSVLWKGRYVSALGKVVCIDVMSVVCIAFSTHRTCLPSIAHLSYKWKMFVNVWMSMCEFVMHEYVWVYIHECREFNRARVCTCSKETALTNLIWYFGLGVVVFTTPHLKRNWCHLRLLSSLTTDNVKFFLFCLYKVQGYGSHDCMYCICLRTHTKSVGFDNMSVCIALHFTTHTHTRCR